MGVTERWVPHRHSVRGVLSIYLSRLASPQAELVRLACVVVPGHEGVRRAGDFGHDQLARVSEIRAPPAACVAGESNEGG